MATSASAPVRRPAATSHRFGCRVLSFERQRYNISLRQPARRLTAVPGYKKACVTAVTQAFYFKQRVVYATLTFTMFVLPFSLMGMEAVLMNTSPFCRWPVVVRAYLMSDTVLSVLTIRS